MIINHNLPGMNANRQMGINAANAGKSMEKLSSGLRINKAGDDAAGLAISEKMRGQIRGLDQASSNAQDGISMVQTAEGALSETHSILQRMRELAVQGSNDTNVAVDRNEIQKEMDELAKEVTRISNNTEFNTQKLINGGIKDDGIKSAKFHVGANSNQDITLSINAMDAKSLGVSRDVTTATGAVGGDVSSVTFSNTVGAGVKDTAVVTLSYNASAGSPAASADQVTAFGGLTFDFSSGAALNGYTIKLGTVADGTGETASVDTGTKVITLNGDFDDTDFGGTFSSAADVETAINAALKTAGLTQTVTVGGTAAATATATESTAVANGADLVLAGQKTVTLTSDKGETQTVNVTGTENSLSITSGNFSGMKVGLATGKTVADIAGDDDKVTITASTSAATATTFASNEKTADAVTEAGIDVSTQATASAAITTIQNAIETVSAERSKLGAYTNRLEHTINNLGTSSENLTSAESRIRDVNMAKEMSTFSKNNILSQAAQAMLSQANQQPQQVLQLLR